MSNERKIEQLRLNKFRHPPGWFIENKPVIFDEPEKYITSMSKNVYSTVEIYDADAINESITFILLTNQNELPFRPWIGANIELYLFEGLTLENTKRMLDNIIKRVSDVENRIEFIENKCTAIIGTDGHSVDIILTYRIKDSGELAEYNKTFGV